MKFNSQICTSREQSERLLALGLKKETADMCWQTTTLNGEAITYPSQDVWLNGSIITNNHFPAWSLARILELMPESIDYKNNTLYLTIYGGDVFYTNWQEHTPLARTLDVYEHLISYIAWLIKEGYFNKEYLVDLTGTDSHQDVVDAFRYAFEAIKAKKEE